MSTIARCRPSENPFASHRIDAINYRPQGPTWNELLADLERLQWRAAVVGPEGSGKTTLLEALALRTQSAVLVKLGGATTSPLTAAITQLPRPIKARHTVFVDAAERLGTLGWWRLRHAARNGRGLVATLHSPGRLPTLVQCTTSSALLRQLVRELAPADAQGLEPTLDELFRRHGGNLRLCFQELYDVCAGRRAAEPKRPRARG
jgi:energy-coupling factor transporter ATP-binding protein EcfA2